MSRPWVAEAPCGWRLDLPWVSDSRPTDIEQTIMASLCAECPVRLRCAAYAVHSNNNRGVDGGFYAGIWIPWAYSSDTVAVRANRMAGRNALKELAALLVTA